MGWATPNYYPYEVSNGAGCQARRRRTTAPVLEFDFKYNGLGMGMLAFNNVSGIGQGGTGVLKVDGNAVATQTMEHTVG